MPEEEEIGLCPFSLPPLSLLLAKSNVNWPCSVLIHSGLLMPALPTVPQEGPGTVATASRDEQEERSFGAPTVFCF